MKDEYSRSHEREFDKEIEDADLPAILGLLLIFAVCVYGLIRFWNV